MARLRKHLFEGMYILNPSLSDEAVNKALGRIRSSLEEKGGEVHKVHDQGRKKLEYEIRGHRQGYYFVLYFDLPTSAMKEIWREYQLNEDLLRFMTLRAEKVCEKIEFQPLPEQ